MNIKDFIGIFPQLFILFIPGFILVEIKRDIRQEYKDDEKYVFITSIVWSFIIKTIFDILLLEVKFITFIKTDTLLYNISLILLSIILGYLISKSSDNKIIKFLKLKILGINTEAYPRVWNAALFASKGTWAIVYFDKKNYAYLGQLLEFSSNPNYDNKEILLSKYKYVEISTQKIISDYTNVDNAYVYLNVKDVTRIELLPDERNM